MSRFQIGDVVRLSDYAVERMEHGPAYGSAVVVEIAESTGVPTLGTLYRVEWKAAPAHNIRTIFTEPYLRGTGWVDRRVPERNPLLDVAAYGPVGYETDSHADAYDTERTV